MVDVERKPPVGSCAAASSSRATAPTPAGYVRIEIQNENLVALEDGEVLASVPDLITRRGQPDRRRDRHRAGPLRPACRGHRLSLPPIWRTAARARDRRSAGLRLRLRLRPCGGFPCRTRLISASVSTWAGPTPTPWSSTADDQVVAKTKQPTSKDVTAGIRAAIAAVIAQPGVDPQRISHVMLGTTHATNAVLERRRLHSVAVLRVGRAVHLGCDRRSSAGPTTSSRAVGGQRRRGRRWLRVRRPRDRPVRRGAPPGRSSSPCAARSTRSPSLRSSPPCRPSTSSRPQTSPARCSGDEVVMSLSHEIGSLGLLPRENATVLNAALTGWPARWRAP